MTDFKAAMSKIEKIKEQMNEKYRLIHELQESLCHNAWREAEKNGWKFSDVRELPERLLQFQQPLHKGLHWMNFTKATHKATGRTIRGKNLCDLMLKIIESEEQS